jgi:sterol desaturase/sphingolipid hydroxylase (fatty acid hydroxylase superfamily)
MASDIFFADLFAEGAFSSGFVPLFSRRLASGGHEDAERFSNEILAVFMPALLLSDLWRASALTFGLLTGYLVYAVVHHATHHWRVDNAWMRRLKRHHALHHGKPGLPARYGVTSPLWDIVFRTQGAPATGASRV